MTVDNTVRVDGKLGHCWACGAALIIRDGRVAFDDDTVVRVTAEWDGVWITPHRRGCGTFTTDQVTP